jgi:hypothetical protein
MSVLGVRVSGIRAGLDPASLVQGPPRVRLDHARIRLSPEGLSACLPPDAPLAVDGIEDGEIHVRLRLRGPAGRAGIRTAWEPDGRLVLRVVWVRAGIVPLPPALVVTAVSRFIGDRPGLEIRGGGELVVDVPALAAANGVDNARVAAVDCRLGELELILGRTADVVQAGWEDVVVV